MLRRIAIGLERAGIGVTLRDISGQSDPTFILATDLR